jgi:rod shape-determining protein MreC
VTSGDGGLLPPGLPVGVLVKDAEGYRVALFADPGTSEDVRIVDFKAPREEPPVATPNDLPAPETPAQAEDKSAQQRVFPVPKAPDRTGLSAKPSDDRLAARKATAAGAKTPAPAAPPAEDPH